MNRTNMKQITAAFLGCVVHLGAHAHPGHGLPGTSHWHAEDTALLLLGTGAVALVAWLVKRRK